MKKTLYKFCMDTIFFRIFTIYSWLIHEGRTHAYGRPNITAKTEVERLAHACNSSYLGGTPTSTK
jgi:hypothetical protein